MTATTFDFTPLLPAGLPPAAARWTGLAKYSFVGGNNDPAQVPLDGLIDALNAVMRREGRTLATYGLESGPQGYRALRQFLSAKLKRDAGISCSADDILIVSGSLQALDLVNATLLARGDTVIVERDTYQGSLNRLTRLGVNTIGIPLDQDGMRMDVLAETLADLVDQARQRLAAVAAFLGRVRAEEDGLDPAAHARQQLVHLGVHGVERHHVEEAAPDARLVRRDDDVPAGMVQAGNGLQRAGQGHPLVAGLDVVLAFVVDGAVAVEDDQFHALSGMVGAGRHRNQDASLEMSATWFMALLTPMNSV